MRNLAGKKRTMSKMNATSETRYAGEEASHGHLADVGQAGQGERLSHMLSSHAGIGRR